MVSLGVELDEVVGVPLAVGRALVFRPVVDLSPRVVRHVGHPAFLITPRQGPRLISTALAFAFAFAFA
jgi:hypothetical protein